MRPRLEAAQSGHLQISELLIKEGADPKLGIIIIRVFFFDIDPYGSKQCYLVFPSWWSMVAAVNQLL